MKLHTNTTETTAGLIFKKKAWRMDARIELTDEEARLLSAHPEVAGMTIAVGRFHDGSMPIPCKVSQLVRGANGYMFENLANQTDFEAQLWEGCAALKSHFDRLKDIASGPRTIEF